MNKYFGRKKNNLPDIFHGTFLCRIQCTGPAYQWTWMFSYGRKLKCRTGCWSFPKFLEILRSISHPQDNHDGLSKEFVCWHRCEQSNHWPQCQIHLKRSFSILKGRRKLLKSSRDKLLFETFCFGFQSEK